MKIIAYEELQTTSTKVGRAAQSGHAQTIKTSEYFLIGTCTCIIFGVLFGIVIRKYVKSGDNK